MALLACAEQSVANCLAATEVPAGVSVTSWTTVDNDLRLPVQVSQIDDLVLHQSQRWGLAGHHQVAIFVVAGSVTLRRSGEAVQLQQGTWSTIRDGSLVGATETVQLVIVSMHGQLVDHLTTGWPIGIKLLNPQYVMSELGAMRTILRRSDHDQAEQLSVLMYRLLLHLAVHEQRSLLEGPAHPIVAQAIARLRTCAARDLDIKHIADVVGVSVSHLHRLFKRVLGTTPLGFAHQQLMNRAREALSATQRSCTDIARELGYDDPLYFSAVFKRHVGLSPRTYRQQLQRAS